MTTDGIFHNDSKEKVERLALALDALEKAMNEKKCKVCGAEMLFMCPEILPDRIMKSSCDIDNWQFCLDCTVEHCVSTNCLGCEYGKYPNCNFLGLKLAHKNKNNETETPSCPPSYCGVCLPRDCRHNDFTDEIVEERYAPCVFFQGLDECHCNNDSYDLGKCVYENGIPPETVEGICKYCLGVETT